MKPHVICLMHSSLDGRTHPSRWRPKGAGTDWFEKIHDELDGDAWVIGRVTGSEFAKGKPYPETPSEKFPRENWFARRDAKTYGVVLDAHGKIGWGRSDIGGDPIVVVLTESVPDSHLGGLRGEGVSYIFAGQAEIDLALTVEILNRELGVKRLSPAIDGARGAPFVFDSTEADCDKRAPLTAMTLESTRQLGGGVLLLRYLIQNDAAGQ